MSGTVSFLVFGAGALVVALIAATVRLWVGPKPPKASSRPVDPAGGWATPEILRGHLSADAVRRAGAQVRPSLPQQSDRKGIRRGSR